MKLQYERLFKMSFFDKFRDHWLGGVIALAAICVGTTWYIANELLVKPRDFEIQRLNNKIAELEKHPKISKGKAKTLNNEDKNTILEATWIFGGKPIQIFSGQIILTATHLYLYDKEVTFSLLSSDQTVTEISLKIGEMKDFKYNGEGYLLSLLDTDFSKGNSGRNARARISITKKNSPKL